MRSPPFGRICNLNAVQMPCADQLRVGVADVGLIPAIEYQRIPGLVVVGDAAIATKGAVRSILLLTRCPIVRSGLTSSTR